ncbi:hypothetical protein PI125_g25938 [Phytophthora idaei]|nr:hypothetical protein PI125_g25938 [Phytophthora idaei]KAG3129423.1 hypothetical protein PI126_g20973 [Phytophthora idaei]
MNYAFDCILGMPWLSRYQPAVDWLARSVKRRSGFDVSEVFTHLLVAQKDWPHVTVVDRSSTTHVVHKASDGPLCTACTVLLHDDPSQRREGEHQLAVEQGPPQQSEMAVEQGLPLMNETAVEQGLSPIEPVVEQLTLPPNDAAIEQGLPLLPSPVGHGLPCLEGGGGISRLARAILHLQVRTRGDERSRQRSVVV